MRVMVRAAAGLPPGLTETARRRLEFALGRFDNRVRSVMVRLADVNGPRGGADKRCLIAVRLDARNERPIVIEDTDAEAAAALDRAANRAARAVARALHVLADRSGRLRRTAWLSMPQAGVPDDREPVARTTRAAPSSDPVSSRRTTGASDPSRPIGTAHCGRQRRSRSAAN